MCDCNDDDRKVMEVYFGTNFGERQISSKTQFEKWYRSEYRRIMGDECPFSPKYLNNIFGKAAKGDDKTITADKFIELVCNGSL